MGNFVDGTLAHDAVLSTTCEPISANCRVDALIDNMALISHIHTWHHQGSVGTLAPEYDLLEVTKGIMAKQKLVVTQEHIKSQQDDDIYYSNLPWNAQLNCDCDWMAGSTCKCQQSMDASPNSSTPQAGHIAPLAIDGTFSSSHIASAIKEAIFHSDFIKYVIHQSWRLAQALASLNQ